MNEDFSTRSGERDAAPAPIRIGLVLPLLFGHFRRIRIGIGQFAHADGAVEVVQLLREKAEGVSRERIQRAGVDVLVGGGGVG